MENKERYLKINLTLLKIVITYAIKISCYAIFKFDVNYLQILVMLKTWQQAVSSNGSYKLAITFLVSFAIQDQCLVPQTTLPQTVMANTVHDFHQLITVVSGLSIIEHIQLRNPGRSEIMEHATRFCISMVIHPDPIQCFHRCGYDVLGILCGNHQLLTGHIPVIQFVGRER